MCGLARTVKSNAQVAFDNVALWYERDISHSGAERVALADSFIAFCTLILAVLFWFDVAQMWHIYILLACRSVDRPSIRHPCRLPCRCWLPRPS